MTDTEQKRIKAICETAHVDDISDLSDGYHTFKQLYYQRMMLFAVIVKQNRDKAWKSLRHSDGELCFGGGWFIVGIDTPKGSYTYHYENKYFDLFDCEILDYGKHWDGHTEKDVTRLLSLEQEPSGDAIDRKLVCAFIAGLISDDREREKGLEYIRHMPPVTPQPCDVAISRQWLMECVNEGWIKFDTEKDKNRFIHLVRDIAPPATPQSRIGRWVLVEDMTDWFDATYECSCCKRAIIVPYDVRNDVYKDYPYCHCGAKMIEPQERSE